MYSVLYVMYSVSEPTDGEIESLYRITIQSSRLKLSLIENFLIPSARPSEARGWMRCSDTQPPEAELSLQQRRVGY